MKKHDNINPDFLKDASGFSTDKVKGVFKPNNESELIEIIKSTTEPLTIRGGGTGITGACVPNNGGYVIAMQNFLSVPPKNGFEQKKVNTEQGEVIFNLSLDKKEAIFPPGISLRTIDRELAALGLWYQPNPTETSAFLGGNVATNASGSRSFGLGATRNHVTSLRMVLMDGDVVQAIKGNGANNSGNVFFHTEKGKSYQIPMLTYRSPKVKNAAGLYVQETNDLCNLIIGSEGILGVVSEVGVKLKKRQEMETYILFFDDETHAFNFVNDCRENKYNATNNNGFITLEYFDKNAIFLPENNNVPKSARAAVEIEFFQDDQNTQKMVEHLYEKHQVIDSWIDATKVTSFRHSIPETINDIIRKAGMKKIATDFAVPLNNFRKMMDLYRETAREYASFGPSDPCTALFGHVGNQQLHFNFIPINQVEMNAGLSFYTYLAHRAVALGGTVSGEHGVGKKTFNGKPLLQLMYGEKGIKEIAAVKKAFGAERLNQGNMVPIKYL